jgi:hypothetical protein
VSTYYELHVPDGGSLDATAVATRCVESGAGAVLLDRAALPPDFFDLSSGAAGELLHRLTLYRIHVAAVVPDPSRCSGPFQDFVREANRGSQFRFFPTRDEAIHWLETSGDARSGPV